MESSSYSPAPKKSKVGIVLFVIFICLIFCCLAPGLFIYKGVMQVVTNGKAFVVCGAEIGAERNALLAYAKDHGNKLPAAAKWQDDIKPYMKDIGLGSKLGPLPPLDGDACDMESSTGVSYNTDVAGKDTSKLSFDQVVLWEVPSRGLNRSEKYSEPSFATSPKIVFGAPRGWIIQPMAGSGYMLQPNGVKQPMPSVKDTSQVGGSG